MLWICLLLARQGFARTVDFLLRVRTAQWVRTQTPRPRRMW